jgi:maltose O-acetyltransferase
MIRYLINFLFWVLPTSHFFIFKRYCLKLGSIKVGKKASICGRGWLYGRGPLSIGKNSWLSPGVIFYTNFKAPIVIGANCDIGPSVEFITGSHEFGTSVRRAGKGIAKPIVVNDGCWIGAGSKILGGVSIGAGTIVASGSVVICDIPENVLVAGVPALVKRHL